MIMDSSKQISSRVEHLKKSSFIARVSVEVGNSARRCKYSDFFSLFLMKTYQKPRKPNNTQWQQKRNIIFLLLLFTTVNMIFVSLVAIFFLLLSLLWCCSHYLDAFFIVLSGWKKCLTFSFRFAFFSLICRLRQRVCTKKED